MKEVQINLTHPDMLQQCEEIKVGYIAKCIEGVKADLFSAMNTSMSNLYTKMREENQQIMQYATRPIITAVPVPNHGLAQNQAPAQNQELNPKQNPNTVSLQNAVYHNPAMYQVNHR